LSDRSQYTVANKMSSSFSKLNYGVPQGSVLGPLLFLIYINDIGNIPNLPSKPILFADDANLFVKSQSIENLQIVSQEAVSKIAVWILSNRLTLNIGKTNYIIFSPRSKNASTTDLHLTINSIAIPQVNYTKFLGVFIDSKLDWTHHISELCISLRKFVGIFFIKSASLLLQMC